MKRINGSQGPCRTGGTNQPLAAPATFVARIIESLGLSASHTKDLFRDTIRFRRRRNGIDFSHIKKVDPVGIGFIKDFKRYFSIAFFPKVIVPMQMLETLRPLFPI